MAAFDAQEQTKEALDWVILRDGGIALYWRRSSTHPRIEDYNRIFEIVEKFATEETFMFVSRPLFRYWSLLGDDLRKLKRTRGSCRIDSRTASRL